MRYNKGADVKITMYRLGHQTKHRSWPYAAAGVLILVLIIASIAGVRQLFQPNTALRQSRPVTHYVTSSDAVTQHIMKDTFRIDVPTGWRPMATTGTPAVYGWHGVAGDDAARSIQVYVDAAVPAGLAVNRLLPVQTSGDQLTMLGNVSDNCVSFTDRAAVSAATGTAPAKWKGVNFICDTGNYERDVVGIGSPAGVNTVVLSSASGMQHRIMLTYTDNSPSPDYSIFIAAAKSFQVR